MPVPLRADYDAAPLRQAARESKDAGQTRRVLALAVIYDGANRIKTAAVGGVPGQIVRDWVLKLNAGGPEALLDDKGPGPQPILTDAHRAALAQAIEDDPIPAIHGVSAGASSTWGSGCPTTSMWPCPSRRSAASCVRWAELPKVPPAQQVEWQRRVSPIVGAPPSPCPGGRRDRSF